MNLMDIVESANDFQDWELIKTNSDSESVPVILPDSDDSFDEVESSGLIWANYFSLDSQDRNRERVDDGESVGSDNPSWIDPGLEEDPARRLSKEARESWPDSSSERSEDRKFRDLEGAYELGFREHEEKEVSSGVIEGKVEEAEDSGNYCMDSTEIDGDSAESNDIAENPQVGVEGDVNFDATSQVLGGEVNESEGVASGGSKNSGELEKRGIVWWKMPMEFLKYCVVRMSPVWTVSVAAAFMGLLILGRRLYKLKRKTRGLKIKVAVDEKEKRGVTIIQSCCMPPCYQFAIFFPIYFAEGISGDEPCCSSERSFLSSETGPSDPPFAACHYWIDQQLALNEFEMSRAMVIGKEERSVVKLKTVFRCHCFSI